jgi:protease YdgD
MRMAAAAATIAACVLVSLAVEPRDGAPSAHFSNIVGASTPSRIIDVDKQAVRTKPGASGAPVGNDSCRWANDHECDDPDIGTGACTQGTDYSDCRAMRAGDDDSCQWARDGECDEPNFGTGACTQATDRTDCGAIAWMRNQNDSCATSFNGVCEEQIRGRGSCAPRTDRSDCHTRDRPMTITDHFFGRDDRVRVNAQQAPWRFMGRFTNADGEMCTATLVARNVLATAAHCIHTDNGVTSGGEFVPAAGGANARAVAYLVNQRYNYRQFTTTDEIDGMDWALVRLDQPLGERLGYAGVRNLTGQGLAAARAADLYQAGYSWDTGNVTMSGNIACHIVQIHQDGTFAHECDTTRGDSGSGFLVRNGSGFDLIGVDSNFRSNPDGPFIYIAVSASQFQPLVADFAAGRAGTAFGRSGNRPPKG